MIRTCSYALAAALLISACTPDAPSTSHDPGSDAVSAFVTACVNTASNPNAAPGRLKDLGFTETTLNRGDISFDSPYATATVFGRNRVSEFGRCVVTPKGADGERVAALLQTRLARSTPPAKRGDDPAAWRAGPSVIFVNRGSATMTRS